MSRPSDPSLIRVALEAALFALTSSGYDMDETAATGIAVPIGQLLLQAIENETLRSGQISELEVSVAEHVRGLYRSTLLARRIGVNAGLEQAAAWLEQEAVTAKDRATLPHRTSHGISLLMERAILFDGAAITIRSFKTAEAQS